MFFRDLNPNADAALTPGAALLRLPIRIGARAPEDAVIRPITKRLVRHGVAAVTAWQVWTRGEGEVLGFEMTLDLTQPTRAGLAAVAKALRSAPCGSSVRFASGGEPVVFGGSEGVEVDVTAPDGTLSDIAARCAEPLGAAGHVRGWSEGDSGARLYIYGPLASRIVSRVRPVLGEVSARPLP